MTRYASLYERLVANSRLAEGQNENGCWEWTGPTSRGYGRMAVRQPGKPNPQGVLAHREMLKLARDMEAQLASDDAQIGDWWDTVLPPVTAALLGTNEHTVDHRCCCQRCVNPDHFEVVTRVENSQRMQERRRGK